MRPGGREGSKAQGCQPYFTNPSIHVEIYADYVKKTYIPDASRPGYQGRKFWREVNAYQSFVDLGVDFVPGLLSYDESSYSLTIEKIDGGDLCAILEDGEDLDFDTMITQLVAIDRYLYENRINYLHSSPKDILYNKYEKKLYIVDFEYTFFDEYFLQILCDRMFHVRIMRVKNIRCRDRFLCALRRRKREFKLYYYRKLKSRLMTRLRLIPASRTKKGSGFEK